MEEVVCSRQGYEKLETTNIADRTQKVKAGLNTIFLYRSIWEGEPKKLVAEIKDSTTDKLREDREDVGELETRLEADAFLFQIEPFVFNNPLLVGRLVLGDDLDAFEKYGFKTKRDFARAITAYCINERVQIQGDKSSHKWRTGNYQNCVRLVDHGDLNVSQIDITGKPGEDVIINPDRQGFGLQQDWSPFLITILKYAEAIGQKDIPEIREWRELAKRVRTSNQWGSKIPNPLNEPAVMMNSLFSSGLAPIEYPLGINNSVVPFLRDGNLEILRRNEQGEIGLFNGRLKYSKIVNYYPVDIPQLLRANYQLFARSVDDMAQEMDYFNSQKTTIEPIK